MSLLKRLCRKFKFNPLYILYLHSIICILFFIHKFSHKSEHRKEVPFTKRKKENLNLPIKLHTFAVNFHTTPTITVVVGSRVTHTCCGTSRCTFGAFGVRVNENTLNTSQTAPRQSQCGKLPQTLAGCESLC